MGDAESRFSGHGTIEPSHRFEQTFGALVRLDQDDRGPPQSSEGERSEKRLRCIGQAGQAGWTACAAEGFEGLLDGGPASDPREKLGEQRKNHARCRMMRSTRPAV